MKKILALLLCLCLLAGCARDAGEYKPTGDGLTAEGDDGTQEDSGKPQNQYLELAYYPSLTLNPYKSNSYINRTVFSLVYQGLFAVDRNYDTTPILCGRFTVSEDMRTYIFYLDPAATFSDGTPVTVEDAYASIEAARKSDYFSGRFGHVNSLTVTEDGGLRFRLDASFEDFPILLDVPIVKAAEVDLERPLGTGPYYYEDAAAGLRLRRRLDWWCTSDLIVTASSIPLQEVSTILETRDAFEFEDVGLAVSDPCSDSYADYRCDYELWDCENGTFLYLACNMDSKVFSNLNMRAALTYAIDRDTIAATYYRGFGQAASLPASPSSPFYNVQLARRYSFDQAKFAQAVANEGYFGWEVTLLVNRGDSLRMRVAQDIAQVLSDCGLKVVVTDVDPKNYRDYLLYGEYDLYLGQTRLSANMDLSSFFRPTGALRLGNLSDANLYTLCLQALANRGNYYNLHETVMEDGRLCPILFHSYSVHSTRGLLTGLAPARDNVFYYSLGKSTAGISTPEPVAPSN